MGRSVLALYDLEITKFLICYQRDLHSVDANLQASTFSILPDTLQSMLLCAIHKFVIYDENLDNIDLCKLSIDEHIITKQDIPVENGTQPSLQ